MSNTAYTPLSTHTLAKTRYDKPFEVMAGYLNHTFISGASDAYLEGTVVDIGPSGTCRVAVSGQGMGFALQSVEDMTAQNGRRNLQQTKVHQGDVIGVLLGQGTVATKIHEGSGNVGDYAYWDGTTLQFEPSGSVPSGVKVIGRLVAGHGENTNTFNGTAGSSTTASSVKAYLLFDFALEDNDIFG